MNKCPYCNSTRIVKNGIKYSKQRYICKDCKRSFCLTDKRVKRNIKEKELCSLLYSHNLSTRSIQDTLEKIFDTKISFSLVQKWIKSLNEMVKTDFFTNCDNFKNKNGNKTNKIEVLDINDFQDYISKLDEKCKKIIKYCLILTENEIKLLQIKSNIMDNKSDRS